MIARLCLPVIVLTIAFSGVAAAQPAAAPKSSPPSAQGAPVAGRDQTKPQQDQNAPARETPVLNTTQAPQDRESRRDSADPKNGVGAVDHKATSDEKLVNLTFWLVIATILLMAATMGLWWETRKLSSQAREASRDTREAIEVARSTSLATASAARSAEVSANAAVELASAERAWMASAGFRLDVAYGGIIDGKTRETSYFFKLFWVNIGKSLATNVSIYSKHKLIDPKYEIPFFEFDEKQEHPTSGVIGIGQVVEGPPRIIYGKYLEEFKLCKKKLAVYTRVNYKSPLRPDLDRYTEFAGIIEYRGEARDSNGNLSIESPITLAGTQNTAI